MPTTGVKTDSHGNPYLELDDIAAVITALLGAGWTLDPLTHTASSYDPTIITGVITPSGKTASFSLIGTVATLTIAGNTRTATIAKTTWLAPGARVTAVANLRAAFPANQR